VSLPDSGSLNDTVMLIMSNRVRDNQKPIVIKRTNRNLIALANVLQHPELSHCSRNDIIMCPCFSHISGIRALLQSITGGSVLALTRTDIRRQLFLDCIEKYGITTAFLMPSDVHYMASNKITQEFNLKSLHDVMYSSATLPQDVCQLIVNKLNLKHFRPGIIFY
jgi:hypothetical protein